MFKLVVSSLFSNSSMGFIQSNSLRQHHVSCNIQPKLPNPFSSVIATSSITYDGNIVYNKLSWTKQVDDERTTERKYASPALLTREEETKLLRQDFRVQTDLPTREGHGAITKVPSGRCRAWQSPPTVGMEMSSTCTNRPSLMVRRPVRCW